jgi:hypothetical protein
MIAGAEEPATLSGLCQPMAIAMVQEKVRQARFDVGCSPVTIAGRVGDVRLDG